MILEGTPQKIYHFEGVSSILSKIGENPKMRYQINKSKINEWTHEWMIK